MRTTNYVPQSRNGNGHLDPCAYEWGAEPLLRPDDIPDGSEGADVANFRGNVVPFPPKPNGHGDPFIPPNLGAEAQELNPIKLLSYDEMVNLPPADWLVDGVVPRRAKSVLFGQSDSYKSFIAIDLGCSVATGQSYHTHATKPCKVIYIANEGIWSREEKDSSLDGRPRNSKAGPREHISCYRRDDSSE